MTTSQTNNNGAPMTSSDDASLERRLLVMDVDSTFITQEVIELLAAHNGAGAEVAAVTEAAMRGELDFVQSLQQRVLTLAGLPESVFATVLSSVVLTPGATELVAVLQQRGWIIGLVSGGFTEIVHPLAAPHGISHVYANRLEVVDGVLTGRTIGPIVDRAAKERLLRKIAVEEHIAMADTVAIGDGANDLDMIGAAGIGIAFNAKPVVRAQAPHVLDGRLDGAIAIIDAVTPRHSS